MSVPSIQKKRIVDYLKEGKRFDGRKPNEYRDIKVEMNISENAEGSCSVKIGKTEVFAGVKLALMEPYPDSPDQGTFMTTMELSPMADNNFEMGPPKIGAIEMGRVIDRGIRESGFIDFKKLCIKEGEKVWQVFLDLYAINNDGNLFDAAGLAGLIALGNAKMPKYDEKTEKIEHELSKDSLPLNKEAMSFNVTIHKIGDLFVVDPSKEEEEISECRVGIAVADNGGKPRITAIQKGKEGMLSAEDMEKILSLVEEQYNKKFKEVNKMVFGK